MPKARVRGVDLHYQEYGAGKAPLVVAHGLMGSVSRNAASGVEVSELANRGFRVIAYDARGHGSSGYSRESRRYTLHELSEDLVGLLDMLGIQRAAILGTSMGAATALWVAARHPERVSSLILKAPGALSGHMGRTRRTMGVVLCAYWCLGSSRTAWLLSRLGGERERVFERLRSQNASAIVPAIRGLVFSPHQIDGDLLDCVQAPTLLIGHKNDPLHPESAVREYHQRLLGSELLLAENERYWRCRGAEFAELVAEFVDQPGASLRFKPKASAEMERLHRESAPG